MNIGELTDRIWNWVADPFAPVFLVFEDKDGAVHMTPIDRVDLCELDGTGGFKAPGVAIWAYQKEDKQ